MGSSYIPLYRKYRPQKFSDIVGQEAVVKTLSNAIELNKVAHAYLLTGPRGTGKTSTARILAKSLNCQDGPTVEPCGVCPSCTDIVAGNAIDVIEIDAASNRKVEDARNLLEKVQFVPVMGKYKVYIIDEVHMLTTEAFNTLLKTLEEPPKNLVFILATTESHKVLNTIISRCQRFDFRRIKQDLIAGRLNEIVKTENLNISEKAVNLISRRSGGGLRDALSLLDQVSILASIEKEVTDEDILTLLGSLQEDTLLKITDAIAHKDINSLIKIIDEIMQLGSEPVQIIREMMNHFRNLLLIKTSNNLDEITTLIEASEQFYGNLKEQSSKFEVLEITQIIEKLANYEKTLKTSSQQHLWLEVALIGIANRQDIQVIKDLETRIDNLEKILSGNKDQIISTAGISTYEKPVSKAPMPKVTPPKPVVPEAINSNIPAISKEIANKTEMETPVEPVEEIRQPEILESPVQETVSNEASSGNILNDWKALLECIETIPSRGFFASLAKPVEINASKIILAFNNDIFVKQAQDKSKLIPLEKAAQKLFGDLPKIITRISTPEDEKNLKNAAPMDSTSIKKNPDPVKRENFEQISQELDIPKPKTAQVSISEEPVVIDEDIEEEIDNLEKKPTPIILSDQAKMVVELFNGKVIREN